MRRSSACTGWMCRCPTPPTSRSWPCRSPRTSSRLPAKSAIADAGPRSMSINILMPALSPTMTEGKLAKWHVKEGDTVKSGQVVCEIETDKATMEVEAGDEGKVGRLVVAEGTEGVKVNAVIAVLLEERETEVPKDAAAPAPAPAAGKPAPASPPGRTARARCGPCRGNGSGCSQGRACGRSGASAGCGFRRRAHLRVAPRQAHCS